MLHGASQAQAPARAADTYNPSNDNVVVAPDRAPSITPEQFLEAIFGPDWKQVWLCSFGPGTESWKGRRYSPGYVRDDHNNYFAIGLMDPGAARRASDSVLTHHIVFADDVGTKVDPEKWEAMFAMGFPEPTFKVETSPGNETWIWVLDRPIHKDDEDRVRALRIVREAFGRLGLSDPLPDDARYIRMPFGVNSKQKYLDELGFAPGVKLTGGSQGAALDIEQAASILVGPDWRDKDDADLGIKGGTSHAGALHRTADLNNPEPLIQLALELGQNPTQVRAGVVEAECPFIDEHTTRADTGFAFLGNGLMECSHASCQQRRTPDFLREMCEQYDDRQAGRAALGMTLGGPATAGEFLARAFFAYHDNKTGQTVSDLVEQAGKMAVSGAVATAQHQARVAQVSAEAVAAEAAQIQQALASALIPVPPVQPTSLPPRRFVIGRSAIAGFLTLRVATGGAAKTAWTITTAIAVSSGKTLLAGEKPIRPGAVIVINGEDDQIETQRRVAATLIHYGMNHADLQDRLYIVSGRDVGLQLARMTRDGPEVNRATVEAIIERAKAVNASLIVLDPLGSLHGLPENDNTAANLLVGALREIAHRTDAGLIVLHHAGKAAAGDMDAAGAHASRGASAFTDGARIVEQISMMSVKEAAGAGIAEAERRDYRRISNGKQNMARSENDRWVRLADVPLNNGAGLWPEGDRVGVPESWIPPTKAAGSMSDLAAVQAAIVCANMPPRADVKSPEWVGWLVAQALGLDAGMGIQPKDRNAEQAGNYARIKGMIDGWLGDGGLDRQDIHDPERRRKVPCIVVGTPAVLVEPVEDRAE